MRAVVDCGGPPTIVPADPARLEAARPRLLDAASLAAEIAIGARPCESPVAVYPVCERGSGQVLLLAAGTVGGAGSRVDGLLWVPAGRKPRPSMALWYVEAPGTPLGHGWHHMVAISQVD